MSFSWSNYRTMREAPTPRYAKPFDVVSQRNEQQHSVTLFDPNPPQPPSLWLSQGPPPLPQEVRDDMVWRDPNPKQRKIQMDKGTTIWGDPTSQGEIKRWKEVEASSSITVPVASAAFVGNSLVIPSTALTGTDMPTTTVGNTWHQQQPHMSVAHSTTTASAWDQPAQHHHVGVIEQYPYSSTNAIMTATSAVATNQPSVDMLTEQIADQLRVAVNKGFININILNKALPKNTLLLLNQLLQRVSKLEATQEAEERVRQQHVGGIYNDNQKQVLAQLHARISNLEHEIRALQENIYLTASNEAPISVVRPTPVVTRSKLAQWSSMGAATSMPNAFSSTAVLTKDSAWGSGGVSESGGQSSVDWSPLKSGVHEFVPGRPWKWQDPRLAASDPHATPATLAPFSMTSAAFSTDVDAQPPMRSYRPHRN